MNEPLDTPTTSFATAVSAIVDNVEKVIVGKRSQVEYLLVAALCRGHVLLEDVPGTGKTMLARSLAVSLGISFKRIQCTPDLLPNDVTGVRIFDARTTEFRFQPGPVFTHVLLADEINRATPRTQAALLEAMQERQVTIDGETYQLPDTFMVLATQNPVEFEGTFPLPEAQLDRFLISVGLGYPLAAEEELLVERIGLTHPVDFLSPVGDEESLNKLAQQAAATHLSPELARYLVAVVQATRQHPQVSLGASPRASLALAGSSRALAAIRGRDYVVPDDIKEMAPLVLAHRVMLSGDARLRGMGPGHVIDDVLSRVAVEEGT
jgi:MoxR-like ATPase